MNKVLYSIALKSLFLSSISRNWKIFSDVMCEICLATSNQRYVGQEYVNSY